MLRPSRLVDQHVADIHDVAAGLLPAQAMTVAGAAARHSPMAGEEVDAVGRYTASLQKVRDRAERTAGHAGAFVHDGEAGFFIGQDFGANASANLTSR